MKKTAIRLGLLRKLRLLKEREYAEIVDKTLDSVRRDRRMGRGPKHIRVNGAIRYRPEDVEEYLAANCK